MNGTFSIKPAEVVGHDGRNYIITHVLDLESVLAKDTETGDTQRLHIQELTPPVPEQPARRTPERDLAVIEDEDWQIAQHRFSIIRPLLESSGKNIEEVELQAQIAGVHRATIYRWIDAYRTTGLVSSLTPKGRPGGKGKSRLPNETEALMNVTIEEVYLHKQKRSVKKTCTEVARRCRMANLVPPHYNTVRNRIAILSEKYKLERRGEAKTAAQKFEPATGTFPGANWPLAVVQIDHTLLDIQLVDDIDRMPIGRPWITLAIDAFSRMVAGMYVSIDPPGALSTGLCIAHAALPKEKWLAKHDIANPWPVWGIMSVIHADNAKEFRGDMLKKACAEYKMDLMWRPVAKPRYGAHIERLMGTFGEEIHGLPGTTFSNLQKRGDYDSEAHAAMTLSEFETWLANFITGVYHQRLHTGIGMSPIKKFEEGILGTGSELGIGLPPKIADEERLRLHLMPFVERTVQRYGIALDDIHYYHNVLGPWINAADPKNPRGKRQFIIRRDPRDISVIFFYDPEVQTHYEIPYRDNSRPPISLWELKAVKKRLADEGREDIDENLIFETYAKMRAMEEDAVKLTKKQRRQRQRRKLNCDALAPFSACAPPDEGVASAQGVPATVPTDKIKPFDELEEF